MSKNIAIKEGGTGRQLTVNKLKINLVGGGTCLWVPEDGIRLGTKYISENGTYRASDDELYGYSEVTVSGVGSVTGKDPETGEDVTVTKDAVTGEIVETVVAAEIRITNEPTKKNYTAGETIDFSGIVVHAYSSTGRDMGAISFNELVFPVTTADASSQGDEWTDDAGVNAIQVMLMPAAGIDVYGHETTVYVGPVMGSKGGYPAAYGTSIAPETLLVTQYNEHNYGLWQSGDDTIGIYNKRPFGTYVGEFWQLTGGQGPYPKNTFTRIPGYEVFSGIPSSTVDPITSDPTKLHAMQSVPVQWTQSGKSTVFEASFSISVTT